MIVAVTNSAFLPEEYAACVSYCKANEILIESSYENLDKHDEIFAVGSLFRKWEKNVNYSPSLAQFEVMFNEVIEKAATKKAKYLLLGAPKSRNQLQSLYQSDSKAKLLECFAAIAKKAAKTEMTICVEPVPRYYGGTFLTNLEEVNSFVKELGIFNVRAMLDIDNEKMHGHGSHCSYFDGAYIHLANRDKKPGTGLIVPYRPANIPISFEICPSSLEDIKKTIEDTLTNYRKDKK